MLHISKKSSNFAGYFYYNGYWILDNGKGEREINKQQS